MSVDDTESECEIEDDNYEDYYSATIDDEIDSGEGKKDPENFQFECLRVEEVEKLLNELVEILSNQVTVSPSLAKLLLHTMDWSISEVINLIESESSSSCSSTGPFMPPKLRPSSKPLLLPNTSNIISHIGVTNSNMSVTSSHMGVTSGNMGVTSSHMGVTSGNMGVTSSHMGVTSGNMGVTSGNMGVTSGHMGVTSSHIGGSGYKGGGMICPVCLSPHPQESFRALYCGHQFCTECWAAHFEIQIIEGSSTSIGCMAQDCIVLAPEDFVLLLLTKPNIREKYQRFCFRDYVKSHPQLRFCPGPNCDIIVRSKEPMAKRVVCNDCKSSFCFRCGTDYHAPTDCEVIKRWLTKCADDSETANYISAHTKDCPKCHICIEKNGGCNHMQCYNCKHDFCWMCLGDWKSHGSEYYECSRYKENPNIAYESVHAQAREALKKYLHYYERWENHSKSLKLEEQTLQRIKDRIEVKVMESAGTWIDWQYLLDAANLLAKCRYTLKYTYPYAYYMDCGPRKELFEYQQAQLEAEIENLSWKIERAESTDRGDLQNQMDIAEKRRSILLKDFLEI